MQTVRLEKNPKASRRTPPTVVTVDIAESWLEWKPTRLLKQAVALCAVVEVAESVGGRAVVESSRAKNAVVDVESG